MYKNTDAWEDFQYYCRVLSKHSLLKEKVYRETRNDGF